MDTRRPWGSGSVFLHKGHWTASIALPPDANGKRRRKWIRAATQEEAERIVDKLRDPDSPLRAPGIRRRGPARLTAVDAVTSVFARARALGWDEPMTAKVIVASLTTARLRLGVIGPCVYCGDELANTVDHVDPYGGDGIENVVSACRKCNNAKGARTPEQWRRSKLGLAG